MTARRIDVATLVACALLALFVFWARPRPEDDSSGPSVLDAMPAEASLVATLDVARARTLGLARELIDPLETDGVGALVETCGFDPADRVRQFAVVISPEPDVGLVASVERPAEPIVECAAAVIRARGGRPVVLRSGSFSTVRDADSSSGGEIAVRDDGLVLVASAPLRRRMMEQIATRDDATHAEVSWAALRRSVPPGILVLTWNLSAAEAPPSDPGLSGLGAVALSVQVEDALRLVGMLECDEPEIALRLARRIERGEVVPWTGTHANVRTRVEGNRVWIEVRLPLHRARAVAAELKKWLVP